VLTPERIPTMVNPGMVKERLSDMVKERLSGVRKASASLVD